MNIVFDMDGTIADFYGVDGWLNSLIASDPKPYRIAKPLVNMNILARTLNELQRQGHKIGIVSWLSKSGTPDFNLEVTEVKKKWLASHLRSVKWDEIQIVPYGTPKSTVTFLKGGILFDDEAPNRKEWEMNGGKAFDVDCILEVLKELKKVG